MHFRLHKWELVCALCRLSIIGDSVSTVSDSPRHRIRATTFHPEGCPSKSYALCQRAPLVYPYHPQCRDTLLQSRISEALSKDDWLLRFAQAMSHHSRYMPTSRLLLQDFQELYKEIVTILSPHTPLALFLPWLSRRPFELQEQIFSFVLDSPGGDVLIYYEAITVLQKMRDWPEQKQRSVSCKGALFARWEVLNHTLYLAGIYDHCVTGSTQITTDRDPWDYAVVRWDDIGVIDIAVADSRSAPHIAIGPGYVQILRRSKLAHEEIWITLQASHEYSRRIFWNNSSLLPLDSLPDNLSISKDIIVSYESFKGVTGISVAHYNRVIVAMHLHREEEDTSLIFKSVRSDATWVHCPLGALETIEAIWYVIYTNNGSGLVVKTSHKVVWLCGYIDPASPMDCFVIAIPSTKAIYHGFDKIDMKRFIIGPIPSLPDPDLYEDLLNPPPWKFPDPPNFTTYPIHRWSCSIASLDGVQKARKSLYGGIQFQYTDYTIYLGDFRPYEASEWTNSPLWLTVISTSDSKQHVEFYSKNVRCDGDLIPMEGYIIMWFCQSDTLIQIENPLPPSPTERKM